jgi:hypothetical protein
MGWGSAPADIAQPAMKIHPIRPSSRARVVLRFGRNALQETMGLGRFMGFLKVVTLVGDCQCAPNPAPDKLANETWNRWLA